MSDKSNENLVLIDADSIIYVVGYELAEMPLEPIGIIKLDEFITDILIATGSRNYQGFFGGKGGHNFRKNIAITKGYKANRADDKPEWFEFWAPILLKRMEEHWGFEPCLNIEADDACAIAAEKYRGKYNKVTIASPDKDLFQIPDMWFYDYIKRTTVYVEETVALQKLCIQIITGDSTDNIPGCFGAGASAAKVPVDAIMKAGLGYDDAMTAVKEFYVEWHTEILRNKQGKKQEKVFLDKYKEDNGISRLTKKIKSDALKDFVVDTSMLLDKTQAIKLFKEQYQLVKLLSTEAEGKKHEFTLGEPTVDSSINWDEITIFHDDMEMMEDEQDFDDIEEIL
jgi:5'-3' exonuclease